MKKNSSKTFKPTQPLTTINPDAAGIDLGSEEIYVCVPYDRDPDFIRRFQTFTSDLLSILDWLKKCRIKTVAMEATGIYWIPLYELLDENGIEAHLVNPRELKRNKKTDVQDCQWLQQMHSYNMLAASFRPENEICVLRALVRHRENLFRYRAAHVQHMQKALHQMNLQLDNVLGDITGVTGMQILRAIIEGNHDPNYLAQFRDYRCKNSEETIRKSLEGNYRKEHLFQLKQSLQFFDFYTSQIHDCDTEIETIYQQVLPPIGEINQLPVPSKKIRKEKNYPNYDLRTYLFQTTGVDLTRISGLNVLTIQTILSETGPNLSKFPSVKHFTSWLRLSPNNRISGGKILTSKTIRFRNRAARAFQMAAHSLAHTHSPLGAYYRKMRAIFGPQKANIATAHKLARIFYFMITRRMEFDETLQAAFEQRHKERIIKNLHRKAKQFGFQLVTFQPTVT
jgi:Transposase and inactivated derivatives